MNKKKYLSIILLFSLCVLLIVPLASATILFNNFDTATKHATAYNNGVSMWLGIKITGNGEYLNFFSIQLKGASGATHTFYPELWNESATPDALIARGAANVKYVPDIDTSIIFQFDHDVFLENGVSYYLGCNCTANGANIEYGASGETGGSWLYVSSYSDGSYHYGTFSLIDDKLNCLVVTDANPIYDVPTPTSTSTPAPTPTTQPTDILSWWDSQFFNLLLPLIVILVVSVIAGYFGGAWGFFAGLNVAVILVYVVMGTSYIPLWGVVLIAVVDALMLFGKVSGRV
jgi:hypothetical protein